MTEVVADNILIFVPHDILENLLDSYLFGFFKIEGSNIYLNCTYSINSEYQNDVLLQTHDSFQEQFCGIVYFSKKKRKISPKSVMTYHSLWFILRIDPTNYSFYVDKMHTEINANESLITNFILYDHVGILNSSFLISMNNSSIQNCFVSFVIDTLRNTSKFHSLNNNHFLKDYSVLPKSNYCSILFNKMFIFLEKIIFYINIYYLLLWWNQILNKTAKWSHVAKQLHQRVHNFKNVYLNWKTYKQLNLKSKNLIFAVLFDFLCGWLFIFTVVKSDLPVFLLNNTISYTNYIVNELESLISWLMGVPAGLKLNIPLNSALGHFFLYHIYLWEAYITIIMPVLDAILKVSNVIGIFGLSFFFCLLSDLFSLATVHVYCFYGYATRLYGYQISCLTALWRLFRGKKWNPLRQRVDSCSYDICQLFLGTLIFTVLLFLLPTVFVYYFVFTCLRIPILLIQGLSSKFIEIFSILPLYSLFLRLVKSPEIAGDLYFTVFNSQATLVLSMQIIQVPFVTVIKNTLPEIHKYGRPFSWKDLVSSICVGNIIYPI